MAGAVAGCGEGAALDRLPAGPEIVVGAVASGDTLTAPGGASYHLAGVEAPGAGTPYARESAAVLASFVRNRRLMLSQVGAPPIAGGAEMMQARLADTRAWVEGRLLDAGAVRVRLGADDRALAAAMLAHEASARRAGRGLWALAAYRVRLPQEVTADDPGLTLVEGRVLRVDHTDQGVELAFETPGGAGMQLRIAHDALREFRSAQMDLDSLEGRLVRARGAVGRDADRTWIDIGVPEQVELLADGRL